MRKGELTVKTRATSEIMHRFNEAFISHDPTMLDELIAEDCVMESIEPAPNGARVEGRAACLAFWQALATNTTTHFSLEEINAAGDRAVIRWRFHFGPSEAESVRGVNLMRVRDGLIVEALGYAKVPAERSVLPIS